MKKIVLIVLFNCSLIIINAQLKQLWVNDSIGRNPECIVYDNVRDLLYISNYTRNPHNGDIYNEDYINSINLKGEIVNSRLISNLTGPTGMCIKDDILYVVERFGLVKFNLEINKVETRYFIKTNGFLNDVTVDDSNFTYITVSDDSIIYSIKEGKVEKWLVSGEVFKPNGIIADGDNLIVGINSDNFLKKINIQTRKVTKVAEMGEGTIDGIKKYGDKYLVSLFEGNLYLVSYDGSKEELLNTRDKKVYCADFGLIEKEMKIVVPALSNSEVYMYQYKP